MDDNEDNTPIKACDALTMVTYYIDHSKDKSRLKEIVETLMVHLDDNDPNVRNKVFESLSIISEQNRKETIQYIGNNKENHTYIKVCDDLIEQIQTKMTIKQVDTMTEVKESMIDTQ